MTQAKQDMLELAVTDIESAVVEMVENWRSAGVQVVTMTEIRATMQSDYDMIVVPKSSDQYQVTHTLENMRCKKLKRAWFSGKAERPWKIDPRAPDDPQKLRRLEDVANGGGPFG